MLRRSEASRPLRNLLTTEQRNELVKLTRAALVYKCRPQRKVLASLLAHPYLEALPAAKRKEVARFIMIEALK
jgi:hypothetical protein